MFCRSTLNLIISHLKNLEISHCLKDYLMLIESHHLCEQVCHVQLVMMQKQCRASAGKMFARQGYWPFRLHKPTGHLPQTKYSDPKFHPTLVLFNKSTWSSAKVHSVSCYMQVTICHNYNSLGNVTSDTGLECCCWFWFTLTWTHDSFQSRIRKIVFS